MTVNIHFDDNESHFRNDTGLIPAVFLCTEYEGNMITADFEMENQRFRTLPDIYSYDLFPPFKNSLQILWNSLTNVAESGIIKVDGGPGSGNFGHEGRPGKIGGSVPAEETKESSGTEEKPKIKPSAKGKNIPPLGFESKRHAKYKLSKEPLIKMR